MSNTVNSQFVSEITQKEREQTGNARPVKGGPAAAAQSHTGEQVSGQVVADIAKGESKILGDTNAPGGPAATAQSIASQASAGGTSHTGKLDSETISKVTDAEKTLTGSENPVRGGPTAQAQKHAGQTINSDTLHDVTEGEKKVTGGDRVKGGPTSTLQSELAQSRQD